MTHHYDLQGTVIDANFQLAQAGVSYMSPALLLRGLVVAVLNLVVVVRHLMKVAAAVLRLMKVAVPTKLKIFLTTETSALPGVTTCNTLSSGKSVTTLLPTTPLFVSSGTLIGCTDPLRRRCRRTPAVSSRAR